MSVIKHTNCSKCERRHATEWSCLKPRELELLDKTKIDKVLSVGDIIFHQGDVASGIYCIKEGLIGLRRMDREGHSILMGLINGGETIGYRALLGKSKHTLTAEVMMPSLVCFISHALIQDLLQKNPELGLRFLDHSLADLAKMEERVMSSETWPVKTRFLHALMVFFERYGIEEAGKWSLELPVSRRDLAELVGTTPETMSRTIKAVDAEGLVSFNGRRVEIANLDAVLDAVPLGN